MRTYKITGLEVPWNHTLAKNAGGYPLRVAGALVTHNRFLTAAALALAIVTGALIVHSWLDARDARAQLAATMAAQKSLIDQASAREAARAAQLAQTLAEVAELKRRVQTPQQVIRELPKFLPALPQPIELKLPESGASKSGEAPPPAIAQVPQADLKPLFDFVQDCRACKLQLDAAQANLGDERGKIVALTRERDAAVRAAKGGGFWARVRRGGKWFAIGVAVGAAAVATHH